MGAVVNKRSGQPYDVYIGRGSIWGNPFSFKKGTQALWVVDTREECIRRHDEWFDTQEHLVRQLQLLWGKTLGCYCSPAACHGDNLLRKVESRPMFNVHVEQRIEGHDFHPWMDYLLYDKRLTHNITMSGDVDKDYCHKHNIFIHEGACDALVIFAEKGYENNSHPHVRVIT